MEKRRALDIDRYAGLLLVNTANTLISLDIDRDCLELGELSVRIHHQAGGKVCWPPIGQYCPYSHLIGHSPNAFFILVNTVNTLISLAGGCEDPQLSPLLGAEQRRQPRPQPGDAGQERGAEE